MAEENLNHYIRILNGDDKSTMGQVLAKTLQIYGVIFLSLFLIYIIFRPWYLAAYNARGVTQLYGHLQWISKLYYFDEDYMIEHCGLDAVSFLRILRFGVKISLVGILNSIYLIPINVTSCGSPSDTCSSIHDKIEKSGLGHVAERSNSLFATTIAAYIFFGSTMYFIFREFRWFTRKRHDFLRRKCAENYTVYVSNIPKKYRTDEKLRSYFSSIFSPEEVLEAHLALNIPNLEKKSLYREKLVEKLEHLINIKNLKGIDPLHKNKLLCGQKVNSIETYADELRKLNEDIDNAITLIEKKQNQVNDESCHEIAPSVSYPQLDAIEAGIPITNSEDIQEDSLLRKSWMNVGGSVMRGLTTLSESVEVGYKTAKSLIEESEDGSNRSAGFVSFKSLLTTAKALQMIHHHKPFKFTVMDAPPPDDIHWKNVGLTNNKIQVGSLISQALTLFLCIIWTFPVSAISTLSKVDELKKRIPVLVDWIEKAPWLTDFLAQLQPLLLILLVVLLRIILKNFSRLEGHIASSKLNVSLFEKLSIFLIIQIFFVQAISGSIFREIDAIIKSPTRIISLLAGSIPAQVISFMQYVLTQTFLGMGLELLRIVPIVIAFVRGKVGPNLTEKEKQSVWLGLRPLAAPVELEYADVLSNLVLYYMIIFAYACMSPIMCYVMIFIFGLLEMSYRNQLIYVYTTSNDSGGQFWTSMIKIIITCMLISEITLFGVLSIKRGVIAAPLMLPVFIVTILFSRYLQQQHYIVSQRLPSITCSIEDMKNSGNQGYNFVNGAYIQSVMKVRLLEPDNMVRKYNDSSIGTASGMRNNDSDLVEADLRQHVDIGSDAQ